MNSILRIVKDISTPLILAGISMAVLFGLYKLIIERVIKKSKQFSSKGAMKIINRIITLVGIIIITSLIFGFLGYLIKNNEITPTTLPVDDQRISRLLKFKSSDGKKPLLESLYNIKFDLNSPTHIKLLKNLLRQIKTDDNKYGLALDIDSRELVYNQAPLVCRDLSDLEKVLQNQLEIYSRGRELIIRLFGLNPMSTYSNDPLLRQIVADFEGKIKTPFRLKGVRLNLRTMKRMEIPLRYRNVGEIIKVIGITLELRIRTGVRPGPSDYDVSHIDITFVPTAGYNIL